MNAICLLLIALIWHYALYQCYQWVTTNALDFTIGEVATRLNGDIAYWPVDIMSYAIALGLFLSVICMCIILGKDYKV